MSFQDFAGNSSSRPRPGRSAAGARPSTGTATTTAGGLSGSTADALRPISESLLQYQRNVGILEKIVQSMSSTKHNTETAEQYSAQVDVVAQLAARVDQQLGTAKQRTAAGQAKTAIIKLERDFHRVQERVSALQTSVSQMRAAQQRKAAASASLREHSDRGGGSGQEAMGHEEFQQLVQMQLQEDRLAEQIMREREEEIRKINQGMYQVNEIYKDLAHIVGSQQEHVDAIETQMEDSRANAEAGLQQVEKANQQFGNAQCIIS